MYLLPNLDNSAKCNASEKCLVRYCVDQKAEKRVLEKK